MIFLSPSKGYLNMEAKIPVLRKDDPCNNCNPGDKIRCTNNRNYFHWKHLLRDFYECCCWETILRLFLFEDNLLWNAQKSLKKRKMIWCLEFFKWMNMYILYCWFYGFIQCKKTQEIHLQNIKQSWSWILLIKWINVESSGEDGQSIRQKQFGGSFYLWTICC